VDDERGLFRRRAVNCGGCGSPFVSPTAWTDASGGRWEVDFRCGACGYREWHVLGDHELEVLERELDQDTSEMLAALDSLGRATELDAANRLLGDR